MENHAQILLNILFGMAYTTPKEQTNWLLNKFSMVPSLIHQFQLSRHVSELHNSYEMDCHKTSQYVDIEICQNKFLDLFES